MAGIVYLKTNCFEVKLEGITFKAKEFEALCKLDFLFPEGKVWASPPIVGIDVMRHPRNPNVILLLLCIGVGCVILRFRSGESLPDPILKFLKDKRIRFVAFGIPEKEELFPFEGLDLTKQKVDIGYLAAKRLNDPKFKRFELGKMARKVLGIKRMIGLTDALSFERHEQIKGAICQLFITSVIAVALLGSQDKKNSDGASKKISFLKSLNSLPLLTEGWFKLPKAKRDNNNQLQTVEKDCDFQFETRMKEGNFVDDADVMTKSKGDPISNGFVCSRCEECFSADNLLNTRPLCDGDLSDDDDFSQGKGNLGDENRNFLSPRGKENDSSDDSSKDSPGKTSRPLKGILKSPSSRTQSCGASPLTREEQKRGDGSLRTANTKRLTVSFSFK